MTRYFDASALVKLYVTEPGSESVRKWAESGLVFTSRLSIVETAAAVARRHRAGEIGSGSLRAFEEALDRDSEAWILQDLTPAVVATARELVRETPLRSADAIHLASCRRLSADLGRPVTMVCYDRALAGAARLVGTRVVGVS